MIKNKTIKSAISIVLSVIILAQIFTVSIFAKSEIEEFSVKCYCNLDLGKSSLDLITDGSDIYISAYDIEKISGYSFKSNDQKFKRGNITKSCKSSINYNFVPYYSLKTICNLLDVEVRDLGAGLSFMGKVHTVDELYKKVKDLIFDSNVYEVNDTKDAGDFLGVGVVEWAYMYDIISSGPISSSVEYVLGETDVDNYREIFMDVLQYDENNPLFELYKDTSKIVSIGDKLATISVGDSVELEDLDDLLASDTISDAEYLSVLANKFTDPLSLLFDYITKGNSDISIEGLDIGSQIDLYKYIDSILNAESIYRKMIVYSYASSNQNYLPTLAKGTVKDITDTYCSDDYSNVTAMYIKDELKTILTKSGTKVLSKFLVDAFLDKGISLCFSLGSFLLKNIFNFVSNASQKMSFIVKSNLLLGLQSNLKNMMSLNMTSNENALIVKYAAMLYLRYAELNSNYRDAAIKNESSFPTLIARKIAELAEYTDKDLTNKVDNSRLNIKELIQKYYIEVERYLSTDFRNFGYSEDIIKKIASVRETDFNFINIFDESDGRKKADKLVEEFLSNTSYQYYSNKTPVFLHSETFECDDRWSTDYVYSITEEINKYMSTGNYSPVGFFVDIKDEVIYGAHLLGSSGYILWIHGNDESYWAEKATALLENTFPEYRGMVSDYYLNNDEILVNTFDCKSFVTNYDLNSISEVDYREIIHV